MAALLPTNRPAPMTPPIVIIVPLVVGWPFAHVGEITADRLKELGAPYRVQPALSLFLPVQLERSPTLGLVAMPKPTRGSGDFISLLGTDGFVELPPGPADYPSGYMASFYRW